jgi:hypothetical protein
MMTSFQFWGVGLSIDDKGILVWEVEGKEFFWGVG